MSLMSRGSVITSRQWYNGTVQMCERNKPRKFKMKSLHTCSNG